MAFLGENLGESLDNFVKKIHVTYLKLICYWPTYFNLYLLTDRQTNHFTIKKPPLPGVALLLKSLKTLFCRTIAVCYLNWSGIPLFIILLIIVP